MIFAGWTSIEAGGGGVWILTDTQLETVIAQTGEERSIFRLDFPFKNAKNITGSINRIRTLNISDTQNRIFSAATL